MVRENTLPHPPPRGCRWSVGKMVGRGIPSASLYRLYCLLLLVKESLSRLFARCGNVQSVDICEKPGPGEKKEKLTSKFFNCKTVTVRLGRGCVWRGVCVHVY